MWRDWHPRTGDRVSVWIHVVVVFAASFALLAARNSAPDFTISPFHHAAINAFSSHDHRPHFDSNGSEWVTPVSSFLPFPPVAVSAHLSHVSQLSSTLEAKGPHYNRPPPVS
jgi:hypothetical protein